VAADLIGMHKPKILVVDDDPKITELLSLILTRVGKYEVREENRPFAAVNTSVEFMPHLVLLEVDMPGKDGGEVYAEMRRHPSLLNVPIIFVTSLIRRSEAGVRHGRRYMAKPVDPTLLLAAVREHCGFSK
jgi:DNA-binding response OmpR family regulator